MIRNGNYTGVYTPVFLCK